MAEKDENFQWEELLERTDVTEEEKRELCNRIMTKDSRMEKLILKNFTVEDLYKVWSRRIGTGLIGGKASGLLVARKLIQKNLPEYKDLLAPHHSYFVGSDVFYEYLEWNDCVELRQKFMKEKERFHEADELRDRLSHGKFSAHIEEQLREIVCHYEDTPIVVRSSSFLEDGFGNAFSGKYESAFCMNEGTEEERLEELENAIRSVYASTMNPSAIEYRRRRKLLDADEQMALLVQKVEGHRYNDFYMPVAAGMGCSYNPYKWMENMNPDAGMLRMVMGLGTRAVQRTPGDYPRLIGLDRAQANLRTTVAERHKFSQRQVDVLDYKTHTLGARRLSEVIDEMPDWQKKFVLSRDTDAEYTLRQRGVHRKVYFADCQGMVDESRFVEMMSDILKMLEKEYERPVDIEFAVSGLAAHEFRVNLLQCRPLQTGASQKIHIPEGVDHNTLFDVRRTSMRRSKTEKLDMIVWVDPKKYYEYPYAKKFDVADKIGEINQYFKNDEDETKDDESGKMLLLVPGRIGTSSPELGVPVVYENISQFSAICEVAYSEAGYHPELSYGSHMFQDLVEADVYYGALNDNSKTRIYQPQILSQYKNRFPEIWPEDTELSEIIKVYDVSACSCELILDMKDGRAVCIIGYEELEENKQQEAAMPSVE